jgi:ABC-type phosphate transport system auxiliary subunit
LQEAEQKQREEEARQHQIDKLLLNACSDGDLEKAKRAIENGADVNAKDEEGWTPLHKANAARINRLENSLAMFQQAVVTSVCELQQNLIAVQENIQNMHRDMHGMAVAIIDTQAAFKKFKASLEFKRKVEAGCSLVSAVLNAVSLGVAGSALQGALGLTLASIADFGNLAHLSGVLKQVATTIGDNVSIHDMLKLGIMLAKGYATQKLEDALKNENAIVVITASAAIFTNALVEMKVAGLEKKRERLIRQAKLAKELDKEFDSFYQQIQLIDEEIEELHDRINNIITASAAVFTNALELPARINVVVPKPSNEELPVFDKPSKDPPIAGEPSKGYNLNDAPSATALPASSSDNVEMEVAGLEKKCERLIRRAKLAKELDKEVDSIYQQIQLLDEEIEELHDRIDNIRI